MAITTRTSGTATIVKLDGVLMADRGVPEFAETIGRLLETGHPQIVLNWDLLYADGAGVDEIVKAYSKAIRLGATIKLVMPLRIGWADLPTITKLLTLFNAYEDEATAISRYPLLTRYPPRRKLSGHSVRQPGALGKVS